MKTTVVNAKYHATSNPLHANNPLITAMPAKVDSTSFRDATTVKLVNLKSVSDSDAERINAVRQIRKLFLPNFTHYEIYSHLYDTIISTYEDRNPTSSEVIEWTYELASPEFNFDGEDEDAVEGSTTTETSVLTGPSGTGKSTFARNTIARLFPQLILHPTLKFENPQIVYLFVDMPHDGTRSGLCMNVFKALDKALKQFDYPKYAELYEGEKIEKMQSAIHVLFREFHVGLFVIDEFQNLNVAAKTQRDEMLQFFDSMANNARVSILKIGTSDAIKIFEKKHQHLRRAGYPTELAAYAKDSDDWKMLVDTLFNLQFVNTKVEKNDKLDKLLYELTCGYPYALVKLWQLAQIEAINSGSEKITLTLLKSVYKRQFSLLHTVFSAIRRKNTSRFEDLISVQQFLDKGEVQQAIKHLTHVVKSEQFNGPATTHLMAAIEAMQSNIDLTPDEKIAIAKIKRELETNIAEIEKQKAAKAQNGKESA
jgi:type II secretory pathway predicted ATPase ExeA